MVTEFLAFPEVGTIGQVLDELRRNAALYSDYEVQYVYITSASGELVGVLRLRDIVLAEAERKVTEVMLARPLSVKVDAPLEELAQFFDAHAFFGVPGAGRRPTGRDRPAGCGRGGTGRSRGRATYLKSQGIVGGEELRIDAAPVALTAPPGLAQRQHRAQRHRGQRDRALPGDAQAVIALAVFLPIISDMSGCSGNQAVAVSMRELSLGLVRPSEVLRVWRQGSRRSA